LTNQFFCALIDTMFSRLLTKVSFSVSILTIIFSLPAFNMATFAENDVQQSEVSLAQFSDTKEQEIKEPETKVGVRVISPFVNKDGEGFSGFSIDLWKKIAERAKLPETKFIEYSNVGELINAAEKKEIDAGIAAVSITADRESRIDFSQPMFDAGLQIMVPGDVKVESSGPKEFFNKIFVALWNKSFLSLVIAIIALGFVLANIAYIFERLHPDGVFSRNYVIGVFQAFWWSLSALASQADHNPRTRQGKVLAIVWMYFSVIFLTFFQAQITSDLTAQKLQGDINGIEDLSGKKVISIAASTASKFLTEKNIAHKDLSNLKDAFDNIANSQSDAFVYDAPPMAFYSNNEGKAKVHLIGEIFKPENYGIALPQNSQNLNKVNLALLSLKEDGTYKELYTKYFGSK
jgi:polar amino acid transport system substrate-binding protein